MPIYAYKCPHCGEQLSKLQKASEPAPACPKDTTHGPMEKQLTTPGFMVKGPGAYSGKMH